MQVYPWQILSSLFISITKVNSQYQGNVLYKTCSTPFQCGKLKNITYPFWGPGRPKYCSHPSFFVNCINQTLLIRTGQLDYQILQIDTNSQALTVTRSDYVSTICPSLLFNTTFDLNLFAYASDVQNITLYYEWKKTDEDKKIEAFMMNYQSLIANRYSYWGLKKITKSFTSKLGQGGFGSVYKGKLADGRLVAVKLLNKAAGDGEDFINEVASISRTSHVNIVNLLGFCFERSKRALLYEYMPNGSLDNHINNQGDLQLEWKTLHEIAVGISRGLEYLHRGCNTRIMHFDIKPHNILLDENFCPKISDFGLAKLCKGKESIVSTLGGARGTAGYIAPEVFMRSYGGVSYKSDVYSYGMTILEMFGGKKNIDAAAAASNNSEVYFSDWIYNHRQPGEIARIHGVRKSRMELNVAY